MTTQHGATEPRPQASRRGPGSGERPGTQLQRDDEHADSQQQRQHDCLDQADPIRREELAEVVDVQHRVVTVDTLDAEDDRDGGDRQQAEQRAADEQLADRLVVARGQAARP